MKYKIKYLLLVCVLVLITGVTYGEVLESGDKVSENSELIYYIDVIYDGKDKKGVESGDAKTAEIVSDIIYVSDKLPAGLTYLDVVTAADGSVGAVKRSDNSPCSGYIVDNKDGIKYENGELKFKVNKLGAGCKLTLGIKTKTPSLNGKERIDFYNSFYASEKDMTKHSNIVHLYMGNDDVTKYKVTYEITGEIPKGVIAPTGSSYVAGAEVGVAGDLVVNGYDFSGWSSEVITGGSTFTMPSKDVVIKGSFTKKKLYNLVYQIDGEEPDGYMPPSTKQHGAGDSVPLDNLKEGDVVDGYKFLGWTSDLDLSEGSIEMPAKDVKVLGKFEKIAYTVTYKFQGTVIPPNAGSLLPATKKYYPGDKVVVEDKVSAPGYKFLAWYKEPEFEMPTENVVIYGEWMVFSGDFKPEITKEIVDKKLEYKKGEPVKFKITVKNTASFEIRDVVVEDELLGTKFIESDVANIMTERMAEIPSMKPGESVEIYAEYTAGPSFSETVVNTVNVIGGRASNNFILSDEPITDTVTFNVKNPKTPLIDTENKVNTGLRGNKLIINLLLAITVFGLYFIFKKKKLKA